jgi:hypothetical protein
MPVGKSLMTQTGDDGWIDVFDLWQAMPAVRSGRLYYRWSLRQHVCGLGGVFDEVLGIKYAGNS